MPTYEYECERTSKRFERFQSMTAEPLKRCPECGGPVHRLIGTGVGVIVKDGGSTRAPSCGRDSTCCGRDAPCDSPSCR